MKFVASRVPWKTSQPWFRWWLCSVRHQAIIWTNDDNILWCHMESLGHNELIDLLWVRLEEYGFCLIQSNDGWLWLLTLLNSKNKACDTAAFAGANTILVSGLLSNFWLYKIVHQNSSAINSLRSSDAYMRHWTGPSLVQIMACHLFGAKPLSEPMLEYC